VDAVEDQHGDAVPQHEASEVVSELTRVLGSAAMSKSPRSRDFLAYIVTETLAGRGERLSERTVGRRALGRADTFDGRFDASVRVRASRLRKSLEEYYATEGRFDRVRIELPAGSYIPRFIRSAPTELAAIVEGEKLDLTIVVLQFAVSGDVRADLVASTISELIAHRLAAFPGLRVVGPATARSQSPRLIGRELGGRFVLQGSVGFREGLVRLSARLTDASQGDVVWAGTETIDAATLSGFEVEEHWAAGVAAELGDYAGVVYRRAAQKPSASVDPLEYAARLAFQAYIEAGNPETLLAAEEALATAMNAGIRTPVILAMRGSTRAVRAAYGMSQDPEADLAAAEELARQALAEDPASGHAHTVLGTVALTRHQWDLARKHAADAALASPFHPTLLATAGTLIANAGDWEQGAALLRESLRLNPLHPGYMHTLLAQDRLMVDDDAAALAEASLIHDPGRIAGPLFRAMALAGLGHTEQARQEMDAVLAIDPKFLDDPVAAFTSYANLTDEQIGALLRHLEIFREPVES
jgi:TolB-like protein/Tfp pilus assembly protein PilF